MCNDSQPKYKRILLKLSGEALARGKEGILDFDFIASVADVLKKCVDAGIQVGVIVGAGNIWRGRQGGSMDRVRADQMGMLATTINALALEETFKQCGLSAVAMTAVEMNAFAEQYTPRAAVAALEEGKVVIFGCGLGAPFFSTDTAGALRAAEIHAEGNFPFLQKYTHARRFQHASAGEITPGIIAENIKNSSIASCGNAGRHGLGSAQFAPG